MRCDVEQNLEPIFRGDTVGFTFEVRNPDGSPMDIGGMTMYFTMKLDNTLAAPGLNDLQDKVTFAHDSETAIGKGGMTVHPVHTNSLLPTKIYHFDFQLVDGAEVYTVASGKVRVLQDTTLVVTP